MLYKTIVLELLEQRPALHEELCRQRKLLATLEQFARELKMNHEAWQAQLWQSHPVSALSQIRSEALELAIRDLEQDFSFRFPSEEEPQSPESETATHPRDMPTA